MAKKPKMDPVLKEQWCTALESGDYEQAREQLRCGSGFCCLGVLLDKINPDAWEGNVWVREGTGERFEFDADLPWGIMPNEDQTVLVNMNDTERDDFKTIAKWIRRNL